MEVKSKKILHHNTMIFSKCLDTWLQTGQEISGPNLLAKNKNNFFSFPLPTDFFSHVVLPEFYSTNKQIM